MSRVYNCYPHRFLSLTFLAIPYYTPESKTDLDLAQAYEKELDSERLGYIRLFNQDDSWRLMDHHVNNPLLCRASKRGTSNKAVAISC